MLTHGTAPFLEARNEIIDGDTKGLRTRVALPFVLVERVRLILCITPAFRWIVHNFPLHFLNGRPGYLLVIPLPPLFSIASLSYTRILLSWAGCAYLVEFRVWRLLTLQFMYIFCPLNNLGTYNLCG
jgi:hypothetical protein